MAYQLAENSVRTYHLSPEGFSFANRKLLGQRIVVFAGIVVVVLGVQYKEFGDSWGSISITSIAYILSSIVLIFTILAFGIFRGYKRSREVWSSFELVIGENFVIRRIKGFPELEIQQNEIIAIKENTDGLRIETAKKGRTIGISVGLVEYQDARARLSRWMPVQELRSWGNSSRWAYLSSILFTGLFVSFYMSTRSWAVMATGLPLLVGLTLCMWYLQRSPHVSSYIKRISLFSILPILAIVAKIVWAIKNWN